MSTAGPMRNHGNHFSRGRKGGGENARHKGDGGSKEVKKNSQRKTWFHLLRPWERKLETKILTSTSGSEKRKEKRNFNSWARERGNSLQAEGKKGVPFCLPSSLNFHLGGISFLWKKKMKKYDKKKEGLLIFNVLRGGGEKKWGFLL